MKKEPNEKKVFVKRKQERIPSADLKRLVYLAWNDPEAYARELALIRALGRYKGYIFPEPKL